MPDQTINADTGQVESNPPPAATPMYRPIGSTIPSIINIPPQVAVTVFWVAVGFGICWWLTGRRDRRGGGGMFF